MFVYEKNNTTSLFAMHCIIGSNAAEKKQSQSKVAQQQSLCVMLHSLLMNLILPVVHIVIFYIILHTIEILMQ